MLRTVSATEARIHFGELMRKVREDGATIVVERAGKPEIVILSIIEYKQRLGGQTAQSDWRERVRRTRELVRQELAGRPLPDIDDLIDGGREERDAATLEGLH
jgi:prevent-host-death family protein